MIKDETAPVGSVLVRLYGLNKLHWVPDVQMLGILQKSTRDCLHTMCYMGGLSTNG